jgi:hypothetical protein
VYFEVRDLGWVGCSLSKKFGRSEKEGLASGLRTVRRGAVATRLHRAPGSAARARVRRYRRCSGNLRRHFFKFAFIQVSKHRRSTQALLTLCSGCSVTFLLSFSVTNYNLHTIRLCRAKDVNSTVLYSEGRSQLPGTQMGCL